METDHIVLIIVAVFAIAGLLLMFLRAFVHDLDSFMRDLFKVIDTWASSGMEPRPHGRSSGEDA